jgi:type I restriction enzyme S subunit
MAHQDILLGHALLEQRQSEEATEPGTLAVPSGWKEVRLGDVCDVTMGQSPPSETYNRIGDGLPFLQGKAEFTDLYPRATMSCTQPTKIAQQGSVLLSVRAPVGDVNLADGSYPIGRGLGALSLRGGDNRFLFYLLQHNQARIAALGSGTTFQSINRAVIDAFRVGLPPVAEQQAIAHTFRTVQDAIQARRREVALERERKAALMQQLFTHGTRGEPTKLTEIGEIPESWQVVPMEDVLREPLKNGHSATESNTGQGVRTLTLTAVTRNDFSAENTKITVADPYRVRDLWLKRGDILIERANTFEFVGLAALYDGPTDFAIYPDLLIRVRLNQQKMLPRFAAGYLLSGVCRAYFRRNARGTAGNMPKIDHGTVRRLPMPLPAVEEQHAISCALERCNVKADAVEREMALLEELFRALLEELMTGRLSALPLVEPLHADDVMRIAERSPKGLT